MRYVLTVIPLLSLVLASGCGGNSTSPTSPGTTSLAGTWTGSATDSTTSSLGTGGMMGQAGMGNMTWQLTQNGSTVTGSMGFSGMTTMMTRGTMSGTIAGNTMTFTMDMPSGSMMSGTCSAHATGTMQINGTTTMMGTYSGTNSCDGPFMNGQMTMSRQ